jgi:serine/threonine protein kinase
MAANGDSAGRSGTPRRQGPAPAAGSGSQHGSETVPAAGTGTVLPEQFGPYRIKKKLGGGGMGAVYLVENTALGREEALKVPHFDAGDGEAVRQRFLQEARAAAGLRHANLCPVYHVAEQDGVCFLTMPYLEGRPLDDFTGRPQPARKAVEVVAKLAQALAAAHAAGVIHRDLKPGNIMMCAGVGPVVMDFGLARQTRQLDQRLTQSGTTLGTPAYMPPEQVRGALDQMGPASDVYSLGVILFELLTGRLPFEERTAEVFAKILTVEPPAPSTLRPGLNPALDAICRKALAKAPADRYPTMKAFAAALIDYLRATPPTEGAGNLVAKSARPAGVFEAETVPPTREPGECRPPRPGGLPVATLVEDRPAGPPRPAADTHEGLPQATLVAEPRPAQGGRRWGLLLGCAACAALLLLVSGLAGVGALVLIHGGSQTAPAATAPVASGGGAPTGTAPPAAKEAVLGDGPAAPVSMSGHGQGACGSIVFLPDGLHAASHCNGAVYVWDLPKRRLGTEPWSFNVGRSPGLVAAAPDGKHLAAFALHYLALLTFDGTSCTADGPSLTFSTVSAVTYSPDGSRLITADAMGQGGRVRITAIPSRAKQKEFLFGAPITALAISPDGKFLVTSSAGEKTIRLLNLEQDRQEDRVFEGHTGLVTRADFSRDGTRLFVAASNAAEGAYFGQNRNADGMLQVWDFATGKGVQTIPTTQLASAAFWPGGRALTGHVDGKVILWDLDTGKELARVPLKTAAAGNQPGGGFGPARRPTTEVTAVAISPDGHHGLAAVADGLVYLFRLPPPGKP